MINEIEFQRVLRAVDANESLDKLIPWKLRYIRLLEILREALDLQLIERRDESVVLTEAGRAFLAREPQPHGKASDPLESARMTPTKRDDVHVPHDGHMPEDPIT